MPDLNQERSPQLSPKEILATTQEDLYPEVTFANERELVTFLDKFRTSLNTVMHKEGIGIERCGLTSCLTRRALGPKNKITALSDIQIYRVTDTLDPDTFLKMEKMFGSVEAQTSQTSEDIRDILVNFCDDVPDKKIDDETIEEFAKGYKEAYRPVAKAIALQIRDMALENPKAVEDIASALSSGWGHTATGIAVAFKEGGGPQQFIADLNAEQFGEEFDRAYVFRPQDALKNGVTVQSIGQGKDLGYSGFVPDDIERFSRDIAQS